MTASESVQGYASPNTPLELEILDSGDLGAELEPSAQHPEGPHTLYFRGEPEQSSQVSDRTPLRQATQDTRGLPGEPLEHVTISYVDLGRATGQATPREWSSVPGDPAEVKASAFDVVAQADEDRIAAKVRAFDMITCTQRRALPRGCF